MTALARFQGPDDQPLVSIVRDVSGGVNNRQHASEIGKNQVALLYNVDIGVVGNAAKRPGSVLIANDPNDDTSVVALHNFVVQGGTDQLLMASDTYLYKWTGSGNWSALKSDFTAFTTAGIISAKESGLSPDDIVIFQNGTDNAFRFDSAGNAQDLGDTNTSPPKTTVMAWYANRVWCLLNDLLYWSDAYDSDYSGAFDRTTNAYRIPVGTEMKLLATRDTGIVVMGSKEIWSINPSVTPAATDKPAPLIRDHGIVSKNAAISWGDNIYYFAVDGFRSLQRTIQDKIQQGTSYPISYRMLDEYNRISWANISKLSMIAYDNKIFIAVPTGAATYDTWVYYPAIDAFTVITGWKPSCWATYKVNSQEFLYYGYGNSEDKVYKAWSGYTDEGTTTTNGTAITYQEEGRKDDLGAPLVKKNGGEITIKAYSSGNYNVSVYVSTDEEDYTYLGVINLSGNTVTLPENLPFTLAGPAIVTEKFHLDNLEDWTFIQIKLLHAATNGTDEVKIFERTIVTYPREYENE